MRELKEECGIHAEFESDLSLVGFNIYEFDTKKIPLFVSIYEIQYNQESILLN